MILELGRFCTVDTDTYKPNDHYSWVEMRDLVIRHYGGGLTMKDLYGHDHFIPDSPAVNNRFQELFV